jgi:hypothetical protein
VWLFGSFAMLINASFSGLGFNGSVEDGVIVTAMGILPPITFMMSAYDGTLGALLLASGLMLVLHRKTEKRGSTPLIRQSRD